MNKITITLSSVTYTIKAQKLLAKNGISSKLIKVDATFSKNGCTHGIEISRINFFDAINLLKAREIPYSVYER